MAETSAPVPPPPGSPPGSSGPPPKSASGPPPTRPRWISRLPLGRIVFGGLLILGGLLWLLDAVNVINVSAGVVLPAALILVGLVLVVASFTGRRHGLLIVVGIVLTITLAFASSFDIRLQGGVGQRVERPSAISGPVTYRLSVGQLTIDLRQTSLGVETTMITASVGIGQLVIQVPSDASVDAHAHVGAGELTIFEINDSGLDVDKRFAQTRIAAHSLFLDLSVGLGQIQVTR